MAVRMSVVMHVLVRAVIAERTAVPPWTERATSAQPRQCVRDGFGGVGVLGAHASDFTCDLTCIDITCHTTYTCTVTSKGLFP